jgi:hypothetical protein
MERASLIYLICAHVWASPHDLRILGSFGASDLITNSDICNRDADPSRRNFFILGHWLYFELFAESGHILTRLGTTSKYNYGKPQLSDYNYAFFTCPSYLYSTNIFGARIW